MGKECDWNSVDFRRNDEKLLWATLCQHFKDTYIAITEETKQSLTCEKMCKKSKVITHEQWVAGPKSIKLWLEKKCQGCQSIKKIIDPDPELRQKRKESRTKMVDDMLNHIKEFLEKMGSLEETSSISSCDNDEKHDDIGDSAGSNKTGNGRRRLTHARSTYHPAFAQLIAEIITTGVDTECP